MHGSGGEGFPLFSSSYFTFTRVPLLPPLQRSLSLSLASTGTLQFEPALETDMPPLILLLMNVTTVWAIPNS